MMIVIKKRNQNKLIMELKMFQLLKIFKNKTILQSKKMYMKINKIKFFKMKNKF